MADEKAKKATFKKLQKENQELEASLKKFAKINENDRKQQIMHLLHQVNEIKDASQLIIGALANLEGVTIKHIHKQINLPVD